MVGRLVGKAERALGIGGGDGEDNRDPHQRFRTSKFSGRVPQRKPDRCFVYFNGKSFSVTAAWGFRRVTARFKKQADATRFAKSLKCRIVKGSEYSRMPKALRAAVQANVPVIMKREKFPRDQAFAAAISMALRGTIKPLKKSARLRKSRARISSKRKKR